MSKGSFFTFVAGAMVGAAAAVLLSSEKGKEACAKLCDAAIGKIDELERKAKSTLGEESAGPEI